MNEKNNLDNYEAFTQKEMDYYNTRITIKLVSDVLSHDNKKVWTIICKKCGEHLLPFVKNIEKKPVDRALNDHNCKEK